MSRLITLLFGAAAGAAAAHYLDPESGRRRRHLLRDQSLAKVRRRTRDAVRQADYRAGKLKGVAARRRGKHPVEDVDDVTLAHKVETKIFRDDAAPKGNVSVNVENGTVYLRGMVADEAWIERLAEEARKVDGVKGVKNLLHRPGTPAPARPS
jgi:osmotically-inducible protein OsmY